MAETNKKKVAYRVRRISDGTYSTGGDSPSFTRVGKAWNAKSAFHAHLAGLERALSWRRRSEPELPHPYKGCVVETLVLEAEISFDDYQEQRG